MILNSPTCWVPLTNIQVSEVAEQLQRSCVWIEQQRAEIQEDYEQVVCLKRRLGLTNRLSGVQALTPASGLLIESFNPEPQATASLETVARGF